QRPAPTRRQNMNFRASCTRRGARKALIWPKTVLVLLVLANPLGLTQLSVLKLSPRNCVVSFSVSLKFLMIEASRLKKPGPRITPRPALPGRTTPCGTGAKHAVLNHARFCALLCAEPPNCCGAAAFGSQTMSGRRLAWLPPERIPSPAGSTLEVVTVKGAPVYVERMPESSHPPNTCAGTPRPFLKIGTV